MRFTVVEAQGPGRSAPIAPSCHHNCLLSLICARKDHATGLGKSNELRYCCIRLSNAARTRAMAQRTQIPLVTKSLQGIAIFEGLGSAGLARIERGCSWRCYREGEVILSYLDASDEVYFIVAGEARVKIYSLGGKGVTFRSLGPGNIFGEYAAIDRGRRSASVEAQTNCLIASMPAGAFRKAVTTNPVVAQALLEHFVREIRELTNRVYEFSTLAVSNRIQAEVLRLANLAPREGKAARIAPAPTHAEIASQVSSHREAVTRELNRLSRIGILERRSGDLIVTDVDRLAVMVHEVTGE
jgi:CRP/FNR family transcriptional regulator, cyclic AMP receptor protein